MMDVAEQNPLAVSVARAVADAGWERLRELDRIADFCAEHENGEVFGDWDRETVRMVIAYHAAKETLLVVKDGGGEIAGVLMWYRCDAEDDWGFVEDWLPDRENGDAVFLAFLFSTAAGVLRELCLRLIEREPRVLVKRLIGVRRRGAMQTPVRVEYDLRLFYRVLTMNIKQEKLEVCDGWR